MGAIRLLAAPIRRIARSRLFQFAAVVAIILLLTITPTTMRRSMRPPMA